MSWKFIAILSTAILSLAILCGCAAKKPPAEPLEIAVEEKVAEQETERIDAGEEAAWYAHQEERTKHFPDLNLDGIGGNDDEAVLTTYRWEGSSENRYTVLSIRLGTGEVLSEGFPGWLSFLFQTGHITSLERESIVLEVSSVTSTFSAATVYVLELDEDGGGAFLKKRVVVGDFTERPQRANCIDVPMLTVGTDILDGDGDGLDAILLSEADINDLHGTVITQTLSWSGTEWIRQITEEKAVS